MKRLVIIAGLLVLVAAISVAIANGQGSLSLLWSQTCDGEVRVRSAVVECWQEEGPPPSPTATSEPGATPTAEPTATATPEPGVSMCAHDPRIWHDLYDEAQGCHYDHEHGDDPSLVNDVFGPAGEWFGDPGWEVGSPAVPAHELEAGHRFWKTYAATGLTAAANQLIGPNGEYIRSFRVQTHVASGGDGIKHRYHGFVTEIEACNPGTAGRPGPVDADNEVCGTFQASGTLDYGNLLLKDTGDPYVFLLPHEPDGQGVDLMGGKRIHSNIPTNTQAVWYPVSWPGSNGYVDVQIVISDGWSWLQPTETGDDVIVRNVEGGNGTQRQLHVLAVSVQPWMPHDGTVFVNTAGYSDPSCATWHDGCGFLTLDNWPASDMLRYAELDSWRYYDSSPAGEDWITFPN